MTNHDPESFLSLEALAATLDRPQRWLRDEADAGRIPCLRIGSRRRFYVSAVRDALLERAAVSTAGEADDAQG